VTTDADLLDLERAGWQALSLGGDAAAAFYEHVLAAQVLMLLPGGMVLDDRGQVVDSMRGEPWDRFSLRDERVLRLGTECAVVAYRVSATRGGQSYDALINSTYVVENGHWRLALHQQTPV
jgi:hypothetical protein